MLNINVLYIYPKIIEVNKEINLFRIVDKNIKESIIVFAVNTNDKYEISLTNTLHGKVIQISEVNNLNEIDLLIEEIKNVEEDFLILNDLSKIEKYILKLFIK